MGTGALIGIDIGGTKTHAVAFDREYRPVAEVLVPTVGGGPTPVADFVARTVAAVVEALDGRAVDGIGVGIPGLVEPATGRVRQAVNLEIGDDPLPLADAVTRVHPAPCVVDNDVNVAALGAHQLLDPQVENLAYLSVGTGIAAGVILGGRLHRGRSGVAGEIGHVPVVPEGPRCECGLRGCLETVASGSAIARQWPADGDRSPAGSLVAAAESGDDHARVVRDLVADHLASAVYLLAITYDVSNVVLGGGVADLGRPFLDPILDGLGRLERQSGFVRSLQLGDRLALKPEGPVGAVGAAVLVGREVDR